MNKTRIAFVDPGSFGLPYDRYYLNSIRRFVDVDFYYSSTLYGEDQISKIHPSVRLFKFNISGSISPRIIGALQYCKLLLLLFLRRDQYSSIHFNWSLIPEIDKQLLPALFGRKLVYTMHNLIPHGSSQDSSPSEHKIARKSQSVVLLSRYAYDSTADINERRFFLQHGLTTPIVKLTHNKLQRVAFVGRVEPYKGIKQFIRLSEKHHKKFRFEISGKWAEQLDDEKRFAISHCEVNDRYLTAEDFEQCFARSNQLIVLPYHNITQSGILFNIIAAGVPFIASRRGDFEHFAKEIGMPEILFEPNDFEDLNRAFCFAIQHFRKISSLICSVQDKYIWCYESETILRLYTGFAQDA